DPAGWKSQFEEWRLAPGMTWVVSGTAPAQRDALVRWLEGERQQVRVLDSAKQLPLKVNVEHPDRVGMDRLLNAVAVNARREAGRYRAYAHIIPGGRRCPHAGAGAGARCRSLAADDAGRDSPGRRGRLRLRAKLRAKRESPTMTAGTYIACLTAAGRGAIATL